MLFNSLEYAVFFPLVLIAYWLLPLRGQNLLLLAASYLFYGWWDYRFLSLLLISTVIDFTVGLAIARSEDESRRRSLLATAIGAQLTILGFFKYFDFFVDSAAGLLDGWGLQVNPPLLQVLLPVGISFYTFQTISYTFDIYRRRIQPTRSFVNFALFVAFFPQLVAGPIERARRLLPQLERSRALSYANIRSGALLILLGLFKKVAIADVMAGIVDDTFAGASGAGSVTLLMGIYAFALQIYGDFSGYTDIARGSSRLFGIELMQNFAQPYLSRNITAFWRTWHISLSDWLHDYLYVPLGGNRRGRLATYRNLMITMLLGGLWHGAAWTFVIWGGLHGIFLAIHRRLGSYVERGYQGPFRLRDVLPALATFHLVCLGWVFFRAESFSQALAYLNGLLIFRPGLPQERFWVLVLAAGLAIFAVDLIQRNWRDDTAILGWGPVARGLSYGTMALAIIVASGGQATPFIYFQF
ncbi:MAG: MBOAT family O-acyltransferase [Acidimicrobiia bacterium]